MVIKLTFEDPSQVSTDIEPNYAFIYFVRPEFFSSKEDRIQIP